jgi:hypothetical protein
MDEGESSMDMSRTRGQMQTKLLDQLATEDYDQVQRRISDLQARLADVNGKIKSTESEVAVNVNNARTARLKHALPYNHQRDIAPALSTFNWSSTGTTHKDSFNWKANPQGGSKHTNLWGEMSKYGDDPAVIMMVAKNKEQFAASKRRKK